MSNGLSGKLAWTEADPQDPHWRPRPRNSPAKMADQPIKRNGRNHSGERSSPRGVPVDASPRMRWRSLSSSAAGPALRSAGWWQPHRGLHPLPARCGAAPIAGRAGEPDSRPLAECRRPEACRRDGRHLAPDDLAATGCAGNPRRRGSPGRYRLNGTMPWVTAASRANLIVTVAALDDGRQMLIALPADRPGRGRLPALSTGGAPGVVHVAGRSSRRGGG